MKKAIALLAFYFLIIFKSLGQNLYFPPVNNQTEWDTISPTSLNWCSEKVDSLYQFLDQQNTKAFIVLKDGKIAIEKYFGAFTTDSLWYWASAGKTLTAYLVGKAQEEGLLQISQPSRQYLGEGWTSEPPSKEALITIRNQLTMTTGLDDGVQDNHCTQPSCLTYLTDAGNRWAYHNAPYTLLEKVISTASNTNINTYTNARLKIPTGMTGFWLTNGFDNVYYSKARSMARFGLLAQNNFKWESTALLTDTSFIRQLTTTSQSMNSSYGYLWWLNGKTSFMAPGTQFVFTGSIAPSAPADMVAAIGKNGQIISISKSMGLVMVRMGNTPGGQGGEVSILFLNQLWDNLNQIICQTTPRNEDKSSKNAFVLYPIPGKEGFSIANPENYSDVQITTLQGQIIWSAHLISHNSPLDIPTLPPSMYIVRAWDKNGRLSIAKWIRE